MSKIKNTEVSYTEALAELENIMTEIQSDEIDVDLLSDKIKRATELIKYCKTKLKTAEENIQSIFEDE